MPVAGALSILLQTAPALTPNEPGQSDISSLFWQSFDFFTILLIAGSIAGVALIFRAMLDIRKARIVPDASVRRIRELIDSHRWQDLQTMVDGEETFPAVVVRAAIEHLPKGEDSVREAAELAASEQCARWFRRIEPLNVIGNLGPLVGLTGTVWGMILAFTSLGQAGGQAGPSDLSLGISKALFHTLLGLLLAIPCLLVFGLYRSVVDRLCNRAMVVCSELIERLQAKHGER
jgi:biopolymer transport protein ExbB